MTYEVNGYPFDFEVKAKYSPIYKETLRQGTLIIPGGGCAHFCNAKGNVCPFCAFPIFARHVVRGAGYENDFTSWTLDADIYWEMYNKVSSRFEESDVIAIFNGGSYFVNSEIPQEFRNKVYDNFSKSKNPKQLMVESKPEFITEDELLIAKDLLGNKELMIGIGLESADNYVRNKLLKKGISKRIFEQSIKMMQKLKVQTFVYVFVKAPELSEKDSLNDSLKTIKYLTELGVDHIALSCAFVSPGTPIEQLYLQGDFTPPKLWTIIEIMNICSENKWPVTIGGFDDQPPPIAKPENCPKCNKEILKHIEKIRETGYHDPEQNLSCECKETWLKEMDHLTIT